MEFKNLDSEETLQHALAWLSSYIQSAIENGEHSVIFTFTPNEDNSLSSIFEFTEKLSKTLSVYGFIGWSILDNKTEKVKLKIMI